MSELEKKIRKDFGDNILVDGNYILSQDKNSHSCDCNHTSRCNSKISL
jgi:hypothetical protein